jgi:hypothetical protein
VVLTASPLGMVQTSLIISLPLYLINCGEFKKSTIRLKK